MKGFNKCLCCDIETTNRKYCSDKCKSKYYYNNREGVKEKKIKYISEKRKSKFYIYGFYYKSNNEPFYIGKGSGDRYLYLNGRSKKFNEIIKNNEFYSKIIQDNLSESKALEIEKKLINNINGLVNINDRIVTEKRKCTLCKRDDVEFYENNSNRRCKECVKTIYENKKIQKEKEKIKSIIEFLEKGDLSIIKLYNLINNK
jgi:hypothetical protein